MTVKVTIKNQSISVFTLPNKAKLRRGASIEVPLAMTKNPRVASLIRKGRLTIEPTPEPVVEATPEPTPEPKTRRRRRGRPAKKPTSEE